jgi:hypothetical protein
MPTIALTSKIARQPKAAKPAKAATTPKTLVCKCADHEGNARQPIDNFSLDAKWAKTNFGRNIWCKSCQKAYRAAKKATSVKNDVQPIAAPRGRRTATIPTPPVAEAAVVEAIANVNAAIEAAA